MINVNQLIEQLRMLPDAALQRVARMYKQDPYIFPMVVSEGTMRKKVRTARQAQATAPQPKVNDQAVASLGYTPEEVGIAGLPAPNVQNMADGGIAGYDDGGFAQHSEPVVRMAEGGVPGYQAGGQPRSIYDLDRDPLIQKLRGMMPDFEAIRAQRGEPKPYVNPYVQGLLSIDPDFDENGQPRTRRESEAIRARQKEVAAEPQKAEAYAVGLNTPPPEYIKRMEDFYRPRNPNAAIERPQTTVAPPRNVPPAASGAAPGAGAGTPPAAPPRAPGAGTGAGAAPADGGIYSLAGRLYDPLEQATQQRLGAMREGATRRAEAERKAFEEGKPKSKAGEGLEALLKKEEEGSKGELEQSKAMAILNAGLAMMSGTSPRALENIGKGAMVGTGQYADALKDFKKAAKERQKMMSNIEEARRAEARDDNKTAMALLQRANDNESKMEAFALDATTSLGFKKADLTGRLYGTQMEQEGAMARTRAQDPLALYRALDPTGKGNIAKGFEAAQTAKREPMTKQALFLEYMKNPLNDPAKFSEYVQQYERQFGPIGSSSGSASQSADQALVQKYLNPPR